MRSGVAIFLIAGTGLLSASLGFASLSVVSDSYRQSDIAVTETPETFRAWLMELSRDAEGAAKLPERVASRLLTMPLEKRRRVAVQLMQQKFWASIAPEKQTPRALQQDVLVGLVTALKHAPMGADLYLAAASLEIRTQGFGSRARGLLEASHIFAPHELPLVLERLALAPTIWPLLRPRERDRMKADLATLRGAAPRQAEKIEAQLAALGVAFQ